MNAKANLVLFAGLLAFAGLAPAQVSETLPSTLRADKTGPAVPSMSTTGDARGSTPTKAVQSAKPPSEAAARTAPTPETAGAATAAVPSDAENLNTTALGEQIRNVSYADRDKLFEALNRRLAAIDLDVDEVRRTAPTLTGDARKIFNLANKEFKAKKRQFEHVLNEARKTKPQDWPAVRGVLATEYETYSVAVTRIEGAGAFGGR